MRQLVALTFGAIVLAVCHAQFIYPDQFELMKLEAERRRHPPWMSMYPYTNEYQPTAYDFPMRPNMPPPEPWYTRPPALATLSPQRFPQVGRLPVPPVRPLPSPEDLAPPPSQSFPQVGRVPPPPFPPPEGPAPPQGGRPPVGNRPPKFPSPMEEPPPPFRVPPRRQRPPIRYESVRRPRPPPPPPPPPAPEPSLIVPPPPGPWRPPPNPDFEGELNARPWEYMEPMDPPPPGPPPEPPLPTPPLESNNPALNAALPSRWRDYVVDHISRGVTKFTIDLDRIIENSDPTSRENILFSPISLTATLAMVLLGSRGKTFEEISKILGLESGVDITHHSEIVHQIFGLLIDQFDKDYRVDKSLPQCKVAFGIFVEDNHPIRPQFRAVSDKVYKSDVINVNFANQSRVAQAMINNWVEEKTQGKIRKLLNEPPSPSTAVIIASALYFSGEWNQHFSEGTTQRKPFHIEPNEIVYVDMMYNGGLFPYYEDEELGFKIIAFPYKGLKISMYAILPIAEGAAALKEAKKRLTPDVIQYLISNMKNSSCIIGFPKMQLSSTSRLQSALETMGLKSLFNPRTADLSILSSGRARRVNNTVPMSIGPRTQNNTRNRYWRPNTNRTNYQSKFKGRDNLLYKYKTQDYSVQQWENGYNLRYLPSRRDKRQALPIDQEEIDFIDFLNSQNLPSFGVDELRNSPGLMNPRLFADSVLHKVEMTVNEKGTEAAAATSILLDRTGDYRRFIANRPFLFFIRHDIAKLMWFWGSINRPTPFYVSS